jgi:hypothetical protein
MSMKFSIFQSKLKIKNRESHDYTLKICGVDWVWDITLVCRNPHFLDNGWKKNQWNTHKRKMKISKMKILEEHEIEKSVRNWCRNSVTSWVKNLWQFVSVKNTKRYLFWKINGYNLWPLNRWDLRLTKTINFIIIYYCYYVFPFFISFSICIIEKKKIGERERITVIERKICGHVM